VCLVAVDAGLHQQFAHSACLAPIPCLLLLFSIQSSTVGRNFFLLILGQHARGFGFLTADILRQANMLSFFFFFFFFFFFAYFSFLLS
jgi:hypothetical protein